MDDNDHKQEFKAGRIDARREQTDRAYAEIMENERKERLEKSMRLRKMRLIKH